MTPDYIVIGAGSAGCVLAHRLTEQPDVRVLLLEAGPPDRNANIHIPAGFSKLFKSEVDWNYQTTPQAHAADRAFYMPRGKTLGGSSSINAMIYIRGHRSDYDGWAHAGGQHWAYERVLPYFKKSECQQRIVNGFHGAEGPLCVSDQRSPNPLSSTFVDAAVNRGYARNDDFNGAKQEGVGLYQVTQRKGKRHSAAAAFVKPIRSRPNLEVVTGTHVTRIIIEGGRAVGVSCRRDGEEISYRASKEVLLAAGALNSPQLLMLSGIGDASELRAHGIDVVADLPEVGKNLQDHLYTILLDRCRSDVTLDTAEKLSHLVPNLLNYLLRKKGPFTSNVAEAGGFVRTVPSLVAPDLQLVFGPLFYLDHGFERPPGNGYSAGAILLRPKSRGSVTLSGPDPTAKVVIDPGFLRDEADVHALVEGFRIVRSILDAEPLVSFRSAPFRPASALSSDAEIAAHIRATADHLYHPVGTCRMGNDDLAVVDGHLRVRGVAGLRVVDASIMPTITGGNTNAPTILIAEVAADLIRS